MRKESCWPERLTPRNGISTVPPDWTCVVCAKGCGGGELGRLMSAVARWMHPKIARVHDAAAAENRVDPSNLSGNVVEIRRLNK